jgi:hypothetical protein
MKHPKQKTPTMKLEELLNAEKDSEKIVRTIRRRLKQWKEEENMLVIRAVSDTESLMLYEKGLLYFYEKYDKRTD